MAAPLNNKAPALLPSSPSSSPSVLCRQNPRPRNSESGDPMRRSFGGSPFPTGKPAVIAHHRGFHNPSPTPANSPSDFSRRNSTGRDKENDKDQFSNMGRAFPAQKGAKNFMSPTISAASKINASPRKKVLAEKNEGPRSSVSFSDVRGLILEETRSHPARPTVSFSDVVSIIGEDKEGPKPETVLDEKPQVEDPYDMTLTDLDKMEALDLKDSDTSDVMFDEKEGSADFDPSFKISPRPTVPYTSPVVAPLDADPLVLPYDPKKNYLSPRPQFLHYRPNPRVEHYFDECKQLEDIFTSESSTDTEASKDEMQSENSEESEEDVASQERESVVEEEEEEVKDDDVNDDVIDDVDVDEDVKAHGAEEMTDQVSKPRRFRAFKLLGWLLVLAVAYFSVSVTISPESELSLLRDSGLYVFYIPPEFKDSARANFEQVGEKLRTWAESSGAYISELISSLGEEEERSWLQFHNLTDWLEDGSFDSVFQQDKAEISVIGLDHQVDMNVKRAAMEGADEIECEAEEPLEQFSAGDVDKTSTAEFHEETEDKTWKHDQEKLETTDSAFEMVGCESNSEAHSEESGREEETRDIDWNSEGEKESEILCEEDAEAEEATELQEAVETETDKMEEEKLGGYESEANYEDRQEETETGHEDLRRTAEDVGVADSSTETTEAQPDPLPESGSSTKIDNDLEESHTRPAISAEVSQISGTVLALSSTLVVVVLAASAFFFTKKAKPVVMPNASASEPVPVTEEPNFNHAAAVQNMIKERFSTLNFQTEADDRMREPCPTEMSSSFEKRNSSSFYSNREPDEAQSGGTRKRSGKKNISRSSRTEESLASSASEYSIGSTSYGSFTTYERIPFKTGLGEEEAITPVRRSSRIRNQHSAH
ncbi:PREDICTED: uncharacterized protein LOC104819526 [Tarenaya hassleriana]|uniref:uncharacterized protein LOC104819526 n=1 Tax=Tarenaya hassleriana TaxID=28532 RepID=UPI00053C4CAD|nr:PREDICTED: uncharacterized protein LOC104819526 [Tarenaya hassleriana]